MSGIRYKKDIAGTGRLMRGPEMQALMRQIAEKVMTAAVATAPVYQGPPKKGVVPGEYKASFSVSVTANGGYKGDRAQAKVVNDSAHSTLVEWPDRYRTLGDAVAELSVL